MPTTNLGLDIINQGDNVSPTPINDNMQKLDKLGVDYVTQQGSSGSWRYRRWKSGTYECWGRYSQQSASPTVQGFNSTGYLPVSMNYPVTFAEAPQLLASARADGNPKSHVAYTEHATSVATVYVGGLDWGEMADLEVCLYAIGRVS